MTTTEKIRDALTARLLELGESDANIVNVLNPVQARTPNNRPKDGENYAILWTLDGRITNQRHDKIQWQQTFAADLAVKWRDTEDMETKLDAIRIQLAACFSWPLSGITCQKQELQSISIGYPESGSQHALVSVVADFTYTEELPITQ